MNPTAIQTSTLDGSEAHAGAGADGPTRSILRRCGVLAALVLVSTFLGHAVLAWWVTGGNATVAMDDVQQAGLQPPDPPSVTLSEFLTMSALLTGSGLILIAVQLHLVRRRVARLVELVRNETAPGTEDVQRGDRSFGDEIEELAQRIQLVLEGYRARLQASSRLGEQSLLAGTEYLTGQVQVRARNRRQLEEAAQIAMALDEIARSARRAAGDLANTWRSTESIVELVSDCSERVRLCQIGAQRLAECVAQVPKTLATLTESAARCRESGEATMKMVGQAKMISINATMEATRCGSSAGGFAVVADEVATLTQHAAGACSALLDSIAAFVAEGHALDERFAELARLSQAQRSGSAAIDVPLERTLSATRSASGAISDLASTLELHAATSEKLAQNLDQLVDGLEKSLHSTGEIGRQEEQFRTRLEQLGQLARQPVGV